jgi:hypothetical protein
VDVTRDSQTPSSSTVDNSCCSKVRGLKASVGKDLGGGLTWEEIRLGMGK